MLADFFLDQSCWALLCSLGQSSLLRSIAEVCTPTWGSQITGEVGSRAAVANKKAPAGDLPFKINGSSLCTLPLIISLSGPWKRSAGWRASVWGLAQNRRLVLCGGLGCAYAQHFVRKKRMGTAD